MLYDWCYGMITRICHWHYFFLGIKDFYHCFFFFVSTFFNISKAIVCLCVQINSKLFLRNFANGYRILLATVKYLSVKKDPNYFCFLVWTFPLIFLSLSYVPSFDIWYSKYYNLSQLCSHLSLSIVSPACSVLYFNFSLVNSSIYRLIQGSLNKFPDFLRMGTFIDSTQMKI